MASLPRPKLSEAEFLALEDQADKKSDFYYGDRIPSGAELTAKAGGSLRHSLITARLIAGVSGRLGRGGCAVYDGNLKVRVSREVSFYPDLSIGCGARAAEAHEVPGPRVVFEVLSPSTALFDRSEKFQEYQRVPGLEQYVLVSAERPRIEWFERTGDGWLYRRAEGMTDTLPLPGVGVAVLLEEIYWGMEENDGDSSETAAD